MLNTFYIVSVDYNGRAKNKVKSHIYIQLSAYTLLHNVRDVTSLC